MLMFLCIASIFVVIVDLQEYLNVKFKETGHSNMYFPQVLFEAEIQKKKLA